MLQLQHANVAFATYKNPGDDSGLPSSDGDSPG
jgi:hypothetical protein